MSERGTSHSVSLTVNGERVSRVVLARRLLVHFLRDTLGLTGTHIGCDTGNCGACSVMVDGKLVKSCMVLAPQVDGAEVETVEGLSHGDGLSPLQEAFHEHHALQCGYCTPGMLMSATYLLRNNPEPSDEEIRRGIRGNICRCTGYVNIVEAIRSASAHLQGSLETLEEMERLEKGAVR
jgi:carbon-monoxide dehydrogenase small subunit